MMLFFVIVFFMFLCFIGFPYEIMEFLEKNWKKIVFTISVLINVILIIYAIVINKSNPESEFKLKQYDVLIKERDSVANESIKLQKQLAEKGKQYLDSIEYYKEQEDTVIVYINKTNKQKQDEINNIPNLTRDSVNKLFSREAEQYIRNRR